MHGPNPFGTVSTNKAVNLTTKQRSKTENIAVLADPKEERKNPARLVVLTVNMWKINNRENK